MAQRNSGYERKDWERYETPEWVTWALVEHLREAAEMQNVLDPCVGTGKMASVLTEFGYVVTTMDLDPEMKPEFVQDFLAIDDFIGDGIIANPPYDKAEEFVTHACKLMRKRRGIVAMLLRVDFDSAKTRQVLFRNEVGFAGKVVLLDRIRWFEGPVPCKECKGTGKDTLLTDLPCYGCKGKGGKMVSPSENHAWYVWDFGRSLRDGPPNLRYISMEEVTR